MSLYEEAHLILRYTKLFQKLGRETFCTRIGPSAKPTLLMVCISA